MSNIYFTSDSHYSHKNICKGTSKWDRFDEGGSHQSTRDFKTLEDMNNAIVKGINQKVKADDVLYHLGDWSFGGIEQIWNFRKQLNCQNVHLIFGNHDQHIESNKILPNLRWASIKDKNHIVGIVEDKSVNEQEDVQLRNLFASTQYVKTIKVGGTTIFLSHYSHRVWDKSHHGRIHLYGHSHGTLEHLPHGKSMDVGIDAYYRMYKKYAPFSLTQILEIMQQREASIIDHHNKTTN